jgi:hypothetical protein
MNRPVPPSEFCIDVILTSKFEAATKRLGLPPSEVRKIIRFVVLHADQGALYLSTNGVALRTIAWDNELTLSYGLNVESAEIYLIDLVEDREPPSPPKRPNFLKSLAKKLAPTIAFAAGKKLIDWIIDHYSSVLQEQNLHDAPVRGGLLEKGFRNIDRLTVSPGIVASKAYPPHKNGTRATTASRAIANSLLFPQYTLNHGRRLTRALGNAQRIHSSQARPVAR